MSYEKATSMFEYFVPMTAVLATAETLSASAAVHGEMICVKRCKVRRIMFAVSTAVVATTTAPVVTFRKRVSPGTAGGQSTIGTLTIPNGTALGKVLYKDVTPVEIQVGQTVCFDHTTAAVGDPAGVGSYGFEVIEDPELAANESNMVASA